MSIGVGFVSHALCGALVTIVLGVVAVRPKIFGGFIAPDVVREVPAAESAGAVGAPCWLVSSSVPVYAVITAALAALVFVYGVILVLMWGLLLPLLPRLRCAHRQLLFHLVHRHCLLLDLVLLVADCLLGARVNARKFFNERLVLRVALWLVLNTLVSGVDSECWPRPISPVTAPIFRLRRAFIPHHIHAFASVRSPCGSACHSSYCAWNTLVLTKTYISMLSASAAEIVVSAKTAYAIPLSNRSLTTSHLSAMFHGLRMLSRF